MYKNELYDRYPILRACETDIDTLLSMMLETYHTGGKILLCGNGGSHADCGHIVGELMKGFLLSRPVTAEMKAALEAIPGGEEIAPKLQRGIPAISLPAQGEVLSAYANDVDASLVYAQLVCGYGRPGDLLIGISTSGNSKNVVAAAVTARALGLKTAALTGKKESKLSEFCDCTIRVPETETFKVQELHLPVYHHLCAAMEDALFGE
ncbi:MAG: SIS domain-containing protein [Oscillospiraceae bacterium]|nr:SIS domain-containing protein [Oscillospiraceae bacterium]